MASQVDAVRGYILEGLASGALARGQKLPAERKLAEELGTTRATVRQAMVVLESAMVVNRHVGRGTYISETAPGGETVKGASAHQSEALAAARGVDASPSQLMQARQMVEPHIAELVVISATEADLKQIRQVADAGKTLTDGRAFEENDISFHRALARATHNELIIAMSELIVSVRHDPEWRKLKDAAGKRNGGRRVDAFHEHRAIADALESRDAAEAGRAMRRHLDEVRINLLGD